ncbi:hypothetical protein CUC15_05315 [Oceanobacillus zhaokaii]|uniref:Uncharacterized protein n=1 Tax=Oceanobacillus zhaokaii TaxID=2052660 RepID=A0A345PEF2_9BACI|nr:hypothetical protein CUC15_05315 [Oceanobacillus zhaokaii]
MKFLPINQGSSILTSFYQLQKSIINKGLGNWYKSLSSIYLAWEILPQILQKNRAMIILQDRSKQNKRRVYEDA